MGLSSWPEKFIDKNRDVRYVTVPYDEPMEIAMETDKAIGVRTVGTRHQPVWIPRSVLEEVPDDVFEELRIAKWFADDRAWEYED